MIELSKLEKTYPDGTRAVKGIDASVAEGEFIVLLGPSGCGKTTTLRMIAGLEIATGGTVRLGGEDVTRLRPSRRDVGMVFQFYALYPHMTVRENIAFPLDCVGAPDRQGAPTAFRVTRLPDPARARVTCDGAPYAACRVTGADELTIDTAVAERAFALDLAG